MKMTLKEFNDELAQILSKEECFGTIIELTFKEGNKGHIILTEDGEIYTGQKITKSECLTDFKKSIKYLGENYELEVVKYNMQNMKAMS